MFKTQIGINFLERRRLNSSKNIFLVFSSSSSTGSVHEEKDVMEFLGFTFLFSSSLCVTLKLEYQWIKECLFGVVFHRLINLINHFFALLLLGMFSFRAFSWEKGSGFKSVLVNFLILSCFAFTKLLVFKST